MPKCHHKPKRHHKLSRTLTIEHDPVLWLGLVVVVVAPGGRTMDSGERGGQDYCNGRVIIMGAYEKEHLIWVPFGSSCLSSGTTTMGSAGR